MTVLLAPPGQLVAVTGEVREQTDTDPWGQPEYGWVQVWSGAAIIHDLQRSESGEASTFVDAVALVPDPDVPLDAFGRLTDGERVWTVEGKPYRVRDGVGPHHTVFELREAGGDG